MPLFAPYPDKLFQRKDVKGLIKALEYQKDEIVRSSAAVHLGNLGDQQAVPSLIQALSDADSLVRQNAAWALAKMSAAQALPALITALKDPHEKVRRNAAWGLGRIGGSQAVAALVQALETARVQARSDEARHAAAEALSSQQQSSG